MRAFLAFIVIVLGLAAVGLYSSAFIVHQNEQALVLRFGKPIDWIKTPGLQWKYPVLDAVEYFDKRILDLDSAPQEVTTSDQKRLIVDAYARYRIIDPLLYYQNVRTEEGVRELVGKALVESEIRRVLGGAELQDVVNEKRETLMKEIAAKVNMEGKDYGIEVVDVRIKRADLPEQTLKSVFARMEQDRVRQATELRAQGEAQANQIRADADRQATIIRAGATRRSDQLRGEGEAERSRIFADAYNRDADFFRFYRSMQAYEQSMKPTDTRLLLSPDSEFFRYFNDPSGKARPAPAPAEAPVPAGK